MLPEIFEPDFDVELVTMTAMYAGSGPAGGEALLPGSVLHVPPHCGVAGLTAKPLKDDGALPPLSEFDFDHCAPQNVTEPVSLLSPTTNAPPPGANV